LFVNFLRQEADKLSGELKRVVEEMEEVRRERTSLVQMNNDLSSQVNSEQI
jgi:hypothetical protein